MPTVTDALVNGLLAARMQLFHWTHWRPFRRALRRPRETQARVLAAILQRNRATRFGRGHGFSRINGPREFAAAVPVQTYESLRPLIDEQERTGAPIVTAERPLMYTQTSGTTGEPKLIPVLRSTLARHRHDQAIQAYRQFSAVPDAYRGKLLMIASPAVEGRLESGTPFGSASGHIYRTLPALARVKYVLPHEVLEIGDYDLKYLTILRLALVHRDITSMGSANPSTFLKLHSVLLEHRVELEEDIAAGTFRHAPALPPRVRTAIARRQACPARRVAELQRILTSGEPTFARLWPELRLLTTWTGGSCGIALSALRPLLPASTRICELGYLSSEFRGTITVDVERNLGVPTVHQSFLEFVERSDWDAGHPQFLTVDAIERGKEYYVVVTTTTGLYRYFMNDLVEVTGRFEATPTIQFLRKGAGVTSITGEKLYENQIIAAVRSTENDLALVSAFFLLLADARASAYRLVMEWSGPPGGAPEQIRQSVERNLASLNVEYAQKRASGRLRALELLPVLSGTGDAYKQDCLRGGQRESQFKLLALQYLDDCPFPFEAYRRGETA